jgi:hypothetical protein
VYRTGTPSHRPHSTGQSGSRFSPYTLNDYKSGLGEEVARVQFVGLFSLEKAEKQEPNIQRHLFADPTVNNLWDRHNTALVAQRRKLFDDYLACTMVTMNLDTVLQIVYELT